MNIGEDLLALVALEEVMYIGMKNYEEGNDEAAMIATDAWMSLHKNRLSLEGTPDRIFLLKGMRSHDGNNVRISFICNIPRLLGNNEKEYEDDDLDQVDLNGST